MLDTKGNEVKIGELYMCKRGIPGFVKRIAILKPVNIEYAVGITADGKPWQSQHPTPIDAPLDI